MSPTQVVHEQRRAAIAGTGLIGASIGLGLRGAGWHVVGFDRDPDAGRSALRLGALDHVVAAIDDLPGVDIAVVATPPSATVATTEHLLASGMAPIITDTASVKAPIVAAIDHPGFMGGHPMAGSHRRGPTGARAELFIGATWVLTPAPGSPRHEPEALTRLIADLGASAMSLDPEVHDHLVAIVSHVPHLVSTALADTVGHHPERELLLALAGGGFRDATRLARGDAALWDEICSANRSAVAAGLDSIIDALVAFRHVLSGGHSLRSFLECAQGGLGSAPGDLAA